MGKNIGEGNIAYHEACTENQISDLSDERFVYVENMVREIKTLNDNLNALLNVKAHCILGDVMDEKQPGGERTSTVEAVRQPGWLEDIMYDLRIAINLAERSMALVHNI